ncbi:MAG TPA: M14 family metallopeptidase [Gemmatimonadales bacterium]
MTHACPRGGRWTRRAAGFTAALVACAACAPATPAPGAVAGPAVDTLAAAPRGAGALPPRTDLPLTRAERTGYAETSTYADVIAFLDSLQARGAAMHRLTMGRTSEGRDIPVVVASRPLVRSAAEARATGRPIVYVQGNIHGGEVEGKEAMQVLLRDLLLSSAPNVLDSVVLIAVPIYNADGNEAWGPQERNRGSQNGPERVGQRANAQGLDLNRDYIKAEAPETRATLELVNEWDPHLFVDLHTTNGSYHGYALTYSPSLHPAAPLGDYTRDSILAPVRRKLRERHGFATFDYGNFNDEFRRASLTDSVKTGWYSYDHRPRFGTNYYGLRNRISVLSEAYSHDPFDVRVAATRAYVSELLSHVAENARSVTGAVRAADARAADARAAGKGIALRATLPDSAPAADIVVEVLVSTGDSTRTEPGVPRGIRRTGRYNTLRIPAFTRFEPTLEGDVPAAFALAPRDTAAVRLLRMHGIRVDRLERPWTGEVQAFVVDSVERAAREFQGHNELLLHGGAWRAGRRELPAGSFIVPGAQPLGRLALVLLDPLTDDGLVTWNHFDDRLRKGGEFPVLRVEGEVPGHRGGRPDL